MEARADAEVLDQRRVARSRPRQALHAIQVQFQLPEFLVAYAIEFSIGACHEILPGQDPAGIAGRRQDQQRRCRERNDGAGAE
ncbi:MAG: hypothetical protein IPG61_03120 [bacterium]|nr:hypothetical protein [bacterium]